jgi:hypothetical protein
MQILSAGSRRGDEIHALTSGYLFRQRESSFAKLRFFNYALPRIMTGSLEARWSPARFKALPFDILNRNFLYLSRFIVESST